MLFVIMPNGTMLRIILVSVIQLSVIVFNVVAPMTVFGVIELLWLHYVCQWLILFAIKVLHTGRLWQTFNHLEEVTYTLTFSAQWSVTKKKVLSHQANGQIS
jgi:hypothetical protein